MSTIFEELLSFSRPYVPVVLPNGINALARRPAANEQDAIEAYFSDEYARRVTIKTEPEGDRESELDRVRHAFKLLSRDQLMKRILETRKLDVQSKAIEFSGTDISTAAYKASEIENEEERNAFIEEKTQAIKDAVALASEQIAREYEDKTDADLLDLVAQVNVNIQATGEARFAQRSLIVYHMLYTVERERAFDNVDQVRQLPNETIMALYKIVEQAMVAETPVDLPFVLPDAPVPAGQPSSSDTSTEVTKTGGKRTRTTRGSSKPRTTRSLTT